MSEISSRVITLFEYFYNNSNIDNFRLHPISLNKISIEHIKLYKEENIKNILEEFKKGKFRLESFKNNNLKLIRYDNSFPVMVKISPYKNIKNLNDFTLEPNRDSFFSYLFSEKILDNKLNFIELPIINFDVKFTELESIINSYPEFEIYTELIRDKKISEIMSVRIRERFFKSLSLETHLEKDKCDIKDILIQVCLALAQITNFYPKFKHNNLILDSINIYFKKDKGKLKSFNIGNNTIEYISPGYELKIGSFEKSSLEPIISPLTDGTKKSDLQFFVSYLLNSKYFNKLPCDKETLEIIKKISNKNNKMDNVKPISPETILKQLNPTKITDKRYMTKTVNTSNTIGHDYYLGKINTVKVKGKLNKNFGKVDFMDSDTPKKIKRNYKITSKTQKGGNPVFKPSSINVPNNPNISNDQRLSYKKLQADKPPIREPPVLAEQKIYQPMSKPPMKPNPAMYPPLHIPVENNTFQVPLPYQYEVNKMPIQNIYNISMADPRGDHSRLARIYENMVPGNQFGLTSTSIRERKDSSDYIKSIMVNMNDGKDVSLSGGEGSLLEHIQLMEVNPYHYTNPYDDLPKGDFLLYTTAYPIRYDNDKERIKLAKNSTGLNMRMYGLTNEEYRSHHSGHGISSSSQYNPWIELEYYKKINEIVKNNKVTPNLVSMHFWVIDTQSRIKYDEIKKIKNKKIITDKIIKQYSEVNQVYRKLIQDRLKLLVTNSEDMKKYNDLKLDEYLRNKIPSKEIDTDEIKRTFAGILNLNYDNDQTKININNFIEALKRENIETLTNDSKVSLGILTESPTHTFVRWASPIYNGSGSLKTMTQTGYHESKVYESILFQFIYGMAVLQENNIAFTNNFDPLYNLFIKDIYMDDRETKHWRFIVDGITYYVPNYGYIAMIDSFYGSKNSDTSKPFINLNASQQDTFENLKQFIDPNFYQTTWREKGGHPVPQEFLQLLTKLNALTSTNIKDYLKVFTGLLNNRIGTKVTVTDMNTIDITRFPRSIKPGSLVARKVNTGYVWVLVLAKDTVNSTQIISKYIVQTDRNHKPELLPSSQLFISNDTIEPTTQKGVKYDRYNMIEMYEI
ncbi:hypothetical protein crov330 [Cafeteria roenbergensis virus]|uniref:Uncharacterized protein n=1 Tax=Cafeteria roenbergensis virus (strain BV-PW1) TaxID=693272 RepID=E3T5A1_CROVB|nr:hypothetical protein crov330 [Cafeteria roenbergensis virus BV-PW1]ADO67364.1 hypothetical protein crov330 [Cafeteria roenbergensis virus BV-PW1]